MTKEAVRVGVRVRPLTPSEQEDEFGWNVEIEGDMGYGPGTLSCGNKMFAVPMVFGTTCTNLEIYKSHVQPIVHSAMNGFNGTVFAYGQTSSGKTYTITGTPQEPGLIALSLAHIFNFIASSADREYLLRVSYLEVYNEQLRDLFVEEDTPLKLQDDGAHGVRVVGANEEIVTSIDHINQLLEDAEKRRHYAATNMNEQSSRSHCIFRVMIESEALLDDTSSTSSSDQVLVSTLNFVDLAGSEKASKLAEQEQRYSESLNINTSLLFLGIVISKLSKGESHIPFRQSKLTRLLANSLGGNAMTAVIANISPARSNRQTTVSTLRFASRAEKVKNKAVVNQIRAEDAMIGKNHLKIMQLKDQLIDLGVNVSEAVQDPQAKAEQEKERRSMELRIQHLTNLILVSNSSPAFETPRKERKRHSICGDALQRFGLTPRTDRGNATPHAPLDANTMVRTLHEERSDRASNHYQSLSNRFEALQKENKSLLKRIYGFEQEIKPKEEPETFALVDVLSYLEDDLDLERLSVQELDIMESALMNAWKRVILQQGGQTVKRTDIAPLQSKGPAEVTMISEEPAYDPTHDMSMASIVPSIVDTEESTGETGRDPMMSPIPVMAPIREVEPTPPGTPIRERKLSRMETPHLFERLRSAKKTTKATGESLQSVFRSANQ